MRNLIALALIATLLLAPFASATVSEVTAEASSSSVTTGTSVTVTSTVTATGSETSSVQLISSPSGITVSDPASGSYSSVAVSTTPVTKTFTITAGSAGTYTYYAQAGSTQSTAKTIVFSDPSVLTISGDSSTVTKSAGETLTLSITLTNSQASAITSSYSLNLPSSYYSVSSGDPQTSTGRSFAVGTTTLSWTISIASGASTGTITFQLGSNTNAFSKSVTIPSSGGTTTPADTSGSTTGGTTTTKSIIVAPNDILTKITVNLKTRVSSPSLSVVKLSSVPVAAPSEKVYQYFNITKSNFNDTNIDNATIEFTINKSWISANDLNNVSLARYENGWNKLKTDLITAGATTNTYKAYAHAFSYFAVIGEKSTAAQQPVQQPSEQPQQQPTQEQPQQLPTSASQNNLSYILIIVAIVLIIGAIGLYFAEKKGLLKMPQKSKLAQ